MGFRCIKGQYRAIWASTGCRNDQPRGPRSQIPPPLRRRDHRAVRPLYITYRLSYRDLVAMMAEPYRHVGSWPAWVIICLFRASLTKHIDPVGSVCSHRGSRNGSRPPGQRGDAVGQTLVGFRNDGSNCLAQTFERPSAVFRDALQALNVTRDLEHRACRIDKQIFYCSNFWQTACRGP